MVRNNRVETSSAEEKEEMAPDLHFLLVAGVMMGETQNEFVGEVDKNTGYQSEAVDSDLLEAAHSDRLGVEGSVPTELEAAVEVGMIVVVVVVLGDSHLDSRFKHHHVLSYLVEGLPLRVRRAKYNLKCISAYEGNIAPDWMPCL